MSDEKTTDVPKGADGKTADVSKGADEKTADVSKDADDKSAGLKTTAELKTTATDAGEPVFDQWLQHALPRPRLQLGVSFRHLQTHGFLSSDRFQSTFVSYALTYPRLFAGVLARRDRAPKRVQILQDFEGLVRSGEMLLVLGRPGSGCSTFLKTLSGDTHGFHLGADAEINYGGIAYRDMHDTFKGESIYLAELDVHFPELALGETLTFAATTRELGSGRAAAARAVGSNVASLFSLDAAFKTPVGDAMIRGISGGEKRRTSLAEAFISGAPFQCWDNSTRGLDSSTALGFITLLRKATDALKSTVVMSIYQASEAMYKNFNKVTLLYEGRQIYFGPVEEASAYFVGLGFVRPNRATTADFLTSLTNPVERIVQEGFADRVPRTPDDFARVWKESKQARAVRDEVDAFNSAHPLQSKGFDKDSEQVKLASSTYTLPIRQQIAITVKRGFLRLRNNPVPAISASVANGILGLLIGSAYFNLGETSDSLDQRSVFLFFSLMVVGFAPAFEVLLMWAQRPIVEKHHRYAFYHPFVENLASMICDLPNKFAIVTTFSCTVYFMANLNRTPSAFFTFFLFGVTIYIVNSMYFRMVGSLSKTFDQTMVPSSIITAVLITYTGFVIPPTYMVSWLAWLRWLNPISYAFESWMINEFRGREFPCTVTIPNGPSYNQVGAQGKICAAIGAEAGQLTVRGEAYLELKYGYLPSHLWRNLGILIGMGVFFFFVHLLAAEYIPAERSRGEILLFRRPRGAFAKGRGGGKGGDGNESGASTTFAQDVAHSEESETDGNNQASRAGGADKDFGVVNSIQRQSAIFHWDGLSYDIKTGGGPRKILNSVDGWVKPGTLTALMGVTGAGKTSLLDVLACRATVGVVSGDVHIDGQLRDAGFQRRIGYVQQEDIHLPTTTVREALNFSALMRQSGDKTRQEKLAYVDTVLKMLDMAPYADAIVGVPGEGLNVEQRKRLTIAVEMVARPELLLFLDEPTSGLDSQTAWSICTLLRKLAHNGQAILCTIHQPSSQIFQSFDRLLLLGKGGETMYFGEIGPEASTLISYFETNGAPTCPPDANPAEWVLEVTKNAPGAAGDDGLAETKTGRSEPDPETTDLVAHEGHHAWFEKWRTSRQKQDVIAHLDALKQVESSTAHTVEVKSEYAASWFAQLHAVTVRLFQEFWRDPIFLWSKLGLCIGLPLLNGLSFLNTELSLQGLTNLLFSIFSLCQIFSTLDQQLITRFSSGRALFEARERRSKTYSWTVFLTAYAIVEFFWQSVAAALIFVTWYFPTGLWRYTEHQNLNSFVIFLITWLFMLFVTSFSHAVAAGIEHPEAAVQVATLLFWLTMLFSGVVVVPDLLPRFWIFMYRLSPIGYFINAIVLTGFINTRITCSAVELRQIEPLLTSAVQNCGDYLAPYLRSNGGYVVNPFDTAACKFCAVAETNFVLEAFGMTPAIMATAWRNFGIMIAFIVFNVLATFGIYWLARVPRRSSGLA